MSLYCIVVVGAGGGEGGRRDVISSLAPAADDRPKGHRARGRPSGLHGRSLNGWGEVRASFITGHISCVARDSIRRQRQCIALSFLLALASSGGKKLIFFLAGAAAVAGSPEKRPVALLLSLSLTPRRHQQGRNRGTFVNPLHHPRHRLARQTRRSTQHRETPNKATLASS